MTTVLMMILSIYLTEYIIINVCMYVGLENLAAVIEDVVVCYRTSPRHKLFIVRALQSLGHVVAMTGINNKYS